MLLSGWETFATDLIIDNGMDKSAQFTTSELGMMQLQLNCELLEQKCQLLQRSVAMLSEVLKDDVQLIMQLVGEISLDQKDVLLARAVQTTPLLTPHDVDKVCSCWQIVRQDINSVLHERAKPYTCAGAMDVHIEAMLQPNNQNMLQSAQVYDLVDRFDIEDLYQCNWGSSDSLRYVEEQLFCIGDCNTHSLEVTDLEMSSGQQTFSSLTENTNDDLVSVFNVDSAMTTQWFGQDSKEENESLPKMNEPSCDMCDMLEQHEWISQVAQMSIDLHLEKGIPLFCDKNGTAISKSQRSFLEEDQYKVYFY